MKKQALLLLTVLIVAIPSYAFQQTVTNPTSQDRSSVNSHYILNIQKMQGTIQLDGVIDEEDWLRADVADNFFMVTPYDTSYSEAKSEIRMTYDEDALYLSLVFFDVLEDASRVVESLRRDFSFGTNDNFLLFLDPFNDLTTGFSFGVNAAGAMWDGTMSNGAAVDLAWDTKWEVVTRDYDDRWVAEMRIPFKSIRYKAGLDRWNINFSRLDLSINEKSSWAPVPRQFPTASLAFTGTLQWDEPPPDPGLQLSVIPYIFGSASRDFEAGTEARYRTDFGLDSKVALSSSLNLDLTYNPDFSQADVDQQITNLDRFELFFPEKRQFFLENSDLFANFGTQTIRPFFSRRIGIDAPVLAGARLSGNPGQNWRIGVMNMYTEETDINPSSNFFVATAQRRVFTRSNISAIFVDRQNIRKPDLWEGSSYNRTGGLQFNLASQDNFWTGRVFAFRSFTDGLDQGSEFSQGVELNYNRQKYQIRLDQYYVGDNFVASAGFIPRTDFIQVRPRFTYRFYPSQSSIEQHGVNLQFNSFFAPSDFNNTDRVTSLGYYVTFHNLSRVDVMMNHNFVELRRDFDPTNTGINFLMAGTDYSWYDVLAQYRSDTRKLLRYTLGAGTGGFFNGNRWFVEGDLNYRFQPYGSVSMFVSYNYLDLPAPWNQNSFWLIGPKIDITFTTNLFFTTFVQYNEQLDNLNINSRFQWRYSPVSDIFIVYTDNYFPETMDARNRAVVFKMNYWFN
ncbi:MAG: hydrolase [Balneolaceae bacterium]|nr:MAG: hydrolase [Balneolaceae bacterium]